MVKPRIARLGSVGLALVFGLALVAPNEAPAKKRKKSKKPVAALFLSAKNKPNSKLYAALLAELTKSASKTKAVRILYGKNLRKVLKAKPERAIGKCGSNVNCIAKLGQKARAELVVYGRISPDGKGIKAQILVVDVAGQSISDRMALSLSSTAQIRTEVAANLDALYPVGGDTAMASSEEEIPLDMILGDEPVEAMAAADTSTEEELPLDFTIADTGKTEPAAVIEPEPEPLLLEPPPDETTEIAAVTPTFATTTASETGSTDSGDSRILTYAGIGVAGLGAAALGVGGYFGMSSISTRDSIERGPGGTAQVDAPDLEKDANDQAGMANLMFGIGGGLVAVGAGLVALDLFVLDGGAPETSVSVGDGSAAASFTWRF